VAQRSHGLYDYYNYCLVGKGGGGGGGEGLVLHHSSNSFNCNPLILASQNEII
jgi:hypothetical protein